MLPITDANMCLWASYYATTEKVKLSYGTIKTYAFGLSYLHTELGFENWRDQLSLFRRCMIGIKRSLGGSDRKLARLPITTDLLNQMYQRLNAGSNYTHALYWAAATLATYGLLRISEFCACDSPSSQDSYKLLYLKQIQMFDMNNRVIKLPNLGTASKVSHYTIHLRSSKTDPFRQGITIHISHPIAVQAMITYLLNHPRLHGAESYLFIDHMTNETPSVEVPLRRSVMINMTRTLLDSMGIDSSLYHGHSFRRGGATSLASKKVPDSVVQVLGRWRSDCFKLYVDFPLQQILDYNRLM